MDNLFWMVILAAIVLAAWGYRLVAHGGMRGAMFGARIKSTIGEMDVGAGRFATQKVVIYRLEPGSAADIGLELRAASLGSYSMQPVRLTKAQARRLSQLLGKAAE